MKILAVDNEPEALDYLTAILRKLRPEDEIVAFGSPEDYLQYPDKKSLRAAFLDINLGKMSGIQLAMDLKQYAPLCNIIYVTAYSEFAYAALQTRPSGYVTKPYTEADIRTEFEHLRYPHDSFHHNTDKLLVKTFGNFEVIDRNDRPLHFSRSISREIFAYLIDQCGFPVTGKDIATDVLEQHEYDRSVSKKLSQYVTNLFRDLEDSGYPNVVIRQNRQLYVDKNMVECDLYDLQDGVPGAADAYHGEYMIEYSWAEASASRLSLPQTESPPDQPL